MKRLKENRPPFTVRSGVFTGRRFERGVTYEDSAIPKEYKSWFVPVRTKTGEPEKKNRSKKT